MALDPSSGETLKADLTLLQQLYRDNPVQNIAVLFTDIVDSTLYFKAHGDSAGRAMLRKHQDIVSPLVTAHGGHIIKLLGDSVMAYFVSAEEALKAAVRMQQAFYRHATSKQEKDRIRIRVGIHYGSVIIEEKDIYGDVVNVAAKITNLANGDQICVSQDVYELARGLPSVRFETVDLRQKKLILGDLKVYAIAWDAAAAFDPAAELIVFLRPLWGWMPRGFTSKWATVVGGERDLWGDRIDRPRELTDKSLIVMLRQPSALLGVVRRVVAFLTSGYRAGGQMSFSLPLQIVVDTGARYKDEVLTDSRGALAWEKIMPGHVYLAADARKLLPKDMEGMSLSRPIDVDGREFFKLLRPEDNEKASPTAFPYRDVMIWGDDEPCFYCGSKGHSPSGCPSKSLPDVTRALHRLGYYPPDTIDTIFIQYVLSSQSGNSGFGKNGSNSSPSETELAHQAFYELKRTFQLRFLRTIWEVTTEDWDNIQEAQCHSEGGMAWLAQDLLRVSDHDRAGNMLKEAIYRNPDFRSFCTQAFLCVERNDFLGAERNFRDALSRTTSISQKIFAFLLLARLYMLADRIPQAHKAVADSLLLNQHCNQAQYLDVLLKYRQGKQKQALQLLTRLIRDKRAYYVAALIDPDFTEIRKEFSETLSHLLDVAREEAEKMRLEADKELQGSKGLLSPSEITSVQSLRSEMTTLEDSRSYFGYLDAAERAGLVIAICKNSMKERRKVLSGRLYNLMKRTDGHLKFMKAYRFKRLSLSSQQALETIEARIREAGEAVSSCNLEQYKALLQFCSEIEGDIETADSRRKRLEVTEQVLLNLGGLVKYMTLFFSIVFLIGLVLLPLSTHYLGILFSDQDLFSSTGIWSYQKSFLILGGITGLFLSFFMILKKVIKNS